ncbi:hypothetical protein [Streptomyces sp. NPDC001492]
MTDPYRNHSVHYRPVVLAAVPDGCRTAVDVGCGDGLLARKPAQPTDGKRGPAGMPVKDLAMHWD